jgi:hypothetical protein
MNSQSWSQRLGEVPCTLSKSLAAVQRSSTVFVNTAFLVVLGNKFNEAFSLAVRKPLRNTLLFSFSTNHMTRIDLGEIILSVLLASSSQIMAR